MISKKGYQFEPSSQKIIKAAIEVHNNLGIGYEEVIYQRALANELLMAGLKFGREQWIDIFYKNKKIGTKRVDFVIEELLVEIKAKSQFDPQDFIQTLSYLKGSNYKTALLLNFGSNKLQIKRIVN